MKIIVHYSEIGTKGKNRKIFEKKLSNNIKKSLGKKAKVYRRYGKIICQGDFGEKIKETERKLKNLPGIANFSYAEECNLNLRDIKEKVIKVLKKENFKTFKISASRSYKKFELNSIEIDEEVGKFVLEKLDKKVNLQNPDITVYIEIGEKEAFVFTKKIPGIGGLPIGISGKVLCSLSGGIDSPVASFLMMKRGCKVVFVHIFNETRTDVFIQEKIKEIVKELTKFQNKAKLYIVPFDKIQKLIVTRVRSNYRMIIYRRFMMKIMNKIAEKEKAGAIVTGDSVGQVASQTLENLNSIYKASSLPVLPPLIGMNKEEIIKLSKAINTYNTSIKPYPDCCSFIIAKHPKTKSNIKKIEEIENTLGECKKLIDKSIKNATIHIFEDS